MFHSSFAILLSGSLALAAPAPATLPAPKGPTKEQIQQAVEGLASPRFAVRERASKLLWEAGAAAESALRSAAKSTDEETANRAKAILDKFDWGIYPDTPPLVLQLVDKFRGGDLRARLEAVGEIMGLRPTRFATLRKVIAHEADETARQQMYLGMGAMARRTVPGLIVANRLDEAGELLEICLSPANTISMGDYAAFQYLIRRIPEAIQRMEALQSKGSALESQRAAEALVYLYRLQKNWPAARKAAAQAKSPSLLNDIAWESDDWKTLAKMEIAPDDGQPDFREGEVAAYQRMAGNTEEFDKRIGSLKKNLLGVEGDDGSAYILAYALLLNRRGSDAVAVLKEHPKHSPDLAFDLLCAQFRFREAFALADDVAKELGKDEASIGRLDDLDIQRGKVLAALGDKDAATQVFRGVLDRVLADLTGIRQRTSIGVVTAVANAGMRDLALECAARSLAHHEKAGLEEQAGAYLEPLFGEKRFAATMWWHAFRLQKPDAEPMATMARVREFADGKADRKKADQLAEWIGKLAAQPRKAVPAFEMVMPAQLPSYATAEAYRLVGALDKAEEFYKKAVDIKPGADQGDAPIDFLDDEDLPSTVPALYRFVLGYADFLMGRKRPKDAAVQYRKAWEMVPHYALPLFLTGNALVVAGDAREGERLKSLAHWVPLGNAESRSRFSEELAGRGFDTDSRHEMELILATSWFRNHYVGNAQLRQARIKARQHDYASAAKHYEKDVIGLFRTGARFVEPRAYLTVPELARTYRARALLAAGKTSEAIAEANAGLVAIPGNVEMAIGLVPNLETAGKKDAANAIYGTVKTAFETAIKDFGSSADLRNSLAWTMVNCNRDLEEARKQAEKAVQLMPKAAGYIDTLAEIHFRQKDRVKALELMKRCATLEPTNPYYRKQLERFATKPFDSPLPDEETGDE